MATIRPATGVYTDDVTATELSSIVLLPSSPDGSGAQWSDDADQTGATVSGYDSGGFHSTVPAADFAAYGGPSPTSIEAWARVTVMDEPGFVTGNVAATFSNADRSTQLQGSFYDVPPQGGTGWSPIYVGADPLTLLPLLTAGATVAFAIQPFYSTQTDYLYVHEVKLELVAPSGRSFPRRCRRFPRE